MSDNETKIHPAKIEAEAPDFPEMEKPELPAPVQDMDNDYQRIPDKPRNLEFIADVPLEVAAELGRRGVTVKHLLELKKGTMLELDKLAGEPLELHFNGKLVARGEAVVVNEKYGIRITDIVNAFERIKGRLQ